MKTDYLVIIGVSSALENIQRRRSVRESWMKYLFKGENNQGFFNEQAAVQFIMPNGPMQEDERAGYNDMQRVDCADGYENLWQRTLKYLDILVNQKKITFKYFMHADDDTFVRIDLLLELLENSPRERFYWGYIWDGREGRCTRPIRDQNNKSYMPFDQYPRDTYPPFASGCGFILSIDLVRALLAQPLPSYRLLDPPFGIHLCGPDAVVSPPVVPVHDNRVRPYPPMPLFTQDAIVQHYLHYTQMSFYYKQAIKSRDTDQGASGEVGTETAEKSQPQQLYEALVDMGLMKR